MPVVVECEFNDRRAPGVAVAKKRLGETIVGENRTFTEALAVGISADGPNQFRKRPESNEPIFTVQLVSQPDSEQEARV